MVVINPTVAMPLKEAAHFKKVLKQLIAEVPLDFKNIRTGQWKSADKQEYDSKVALFLKDTEGKYMYDNDIVFEKDYLNPQKWVKSFHEAGTTYDYETAKALVQSVCTGPAWKQVPVKRESRREGVAFVSAKAVVEVFKQYEKSDRFKSFVVVSQKFYYLEAKN